MQVAQNPVIVSTGMLGAVQTVPIIEPPAPRTVRIGPTNALGILQIVIGALCCILGILEVAFAANTYWVSQIGFGIWGGVWIIIGGILGVCSAANATSHGLNGTNMAFAIVSSCITFLDIILYALAIVNGSNTSCLYGGYSYYDNSCFSSTSSTGLALSILILLCVLAEFVLSIIVAVYCGKFGSGCCGYSSSGVIVQQQPLMIQAPAMTYAQQPGMAYSQQPGTAYSQQSVVSYPGAPMVSQQYGQPQVPMAYTTSPGYVQAAPTTVYTTVKTDQPPQGDIPPPYASQ